MKTTSILILLFISAIVFASIAPGAELAASDSQPWIKIFRETPDTIIVYPTVAWKHNYYAGGVGCRKPASYSAVCITPGILGKSAITKLGEFRFTPSATDSGKSCTFRIAASDTAGLADTVYTHFAISDFIPMQFELSTSQPGYHRKVETLTLSYAGTPLIAKQLDFVLAFNPNELAFTKLETDSALNEQVSLRIRADTSTGLITEDSLPICYLRIHVGQENQQSWQLKSGGLLRLTFAHGYPLDSNDGYVPLNFDCSDCPNNQIVEPDGTRLRVCTTVSWNYRDGRGDYDSVYDRDWYLFTETRPTVGGCCHDNPSIRCNLVFRNGGIDDRGDGFSGSNGDVDLNGIGFEFTDYELLHNFLFKGESVLNPEILSHHLWPNAIDINHDKQAATLADAIFIQKVLMGDIIFSGQLHNSAGTVALSYHADTLFVDTPIPLEAIRLQLDHCDSTFVPGNLTALEMNYSVADTGAIVLLTPRFRGQYSRNGNMCKAGVHPLLILPEHPAITTSEVVDYRANDVALEIPE